MTQPVRDPQHETPVPTAWRPVLARVVGLLAEGAGDQVAGLSRVEAPPDFAQDCRAAVEAYGAASLVPLPEQAWVSSVCRWQGEWWDCLVDLWTEAGRSDLVLELSVREDDGGHRFCLHSVHVP